MSGMNNSTVERFLRMHDATVEALRQFIHDNKVAALMLLDEARARRAEFVEPTPSVPEAHEADAEGYTYTFDHQLVMRWGDARDCGATYYDRSDDDPWGCADGFRLYGTPISPSRARELLSKHNPSLAEQIKDAKGEGYTYHWAEQSMTLYRTRDGVRWSIDANAASDTWRIASSWAEQAVHEVSEAYARSLAPHGFAPAPSPDTEKQRAEDAVDWKALCVQASKAIAAVGDRVSHISLRGGDFSDFLNAGSIREVTQIGHEIDQALKQQEVSA